MDALQRSAQRQCRLSLFAARRKRRDKEIRIDAVEDRRSRGQRSNAQACMPSIVEDGSGRRHSQSEQGPIAKRIRRGLELGPTNGLGAGRTVRSFSTHIGDRSAKR